MQQGDTMRNVKKYMYLFKKKEIKETNKKRRKDEVIK